jgi:hypothetical protein
MMSPKKCGVTKRFIPLSQKNDDPTGSFATLPCAGKAAWHSNPRDIIAAMATASDTI